MLDRMISLLKKVFPVSWHYALSNIKRSLLGYTTYAQYGEDKIVMELFREQPTGRYVDVGAHHPYRYSNTYLLYKKGWRGINIDANPHSIALFEKARPDDENVCSGVGSPAVLTYYEFSDPAVNTFDARKAEEWKQKSFLKFTGTTDVRVRPLSELVSGPIDLLTIDVEGMDLEVLKSYDWAQHPKVIIVEGEDSKQFLLDKGYVFYARTGASCVYTYGH